MLFNNQGSNSGKNQSTDNCPICGERTIKKERSDNLLYLPAIFAESGAIGPAHMCPHRNKAWHRKAASLRRQRSGGQAGINPWRNRDLKYLVASNITVQGLCIDANRKSKRQRKS